MSWSFHFKLLPDEEIIEDSTKKPHQGIKPTYSIFLTSKRVIFKFNGIGSSLTQSFFYDDILDVKPCKRLFVDYLHLKTRRKDFFLNTAHTEYWTERVFKIKEDLKGSVDESIKARQATADRKKRELLDMLTVLQNNSLLTEKEFEEKVQLLDAMKL